MNKTANLIVGIIILVIALVSLGVSAASGSLNLKTIVLDGALLLFAVSRFMMFASPNAMLIKPLRTIALFGVIAYYVMPKT
jgi:hypothetical protein